MSHKVDARGLSCPQPVVLTKHKIDDLGQGTVEVIVDTAASRDNVSRMAAHRGWGVQVKEDGDDFILTLTRP